MLVGPLVAALVLILTLQQTMNSLHRAGLWAGNARFGTVRSDDPYGRLDQSIARAHAAAPGTGLRDPFSFYTTPSVAVHHTTTPVVKAPKVVLPVLTAIISDADPRALIHLNGHDYTVRAGGLFDEYRVISITRDQVTLDHNGQSLVLNRPLKGE
jgi:hypothetical protein